jgi:hypothetical protein
LTPDRWQRLLPAAVIAARILIFLGIVLIGAYVWTAVIEPWGQPDQSLLYWLAFLPITGLLMFKWSFLLLRRVRREKNKAQENTP